MAPLKKNEKIMLIAVGAVVLYFAIDDPYYLWKSPPEAPPPEGQVAAAPAKPGGIPADAIDAASPAGASAATNESGGRERIDVEYWGRDPFVQTRKHLDTVTELSSLKLGAISVRGGDRMALINSQPVREGDEIGGMIVERIEKRRVILSLEGMSYTLTWED